MSRIFLSPSRYYCGLNKEKYQDNREVLKEIFNNPRIISEIKDNLYLDTPIFQKFEKLNELKSKGAHKSDHPEYNEYYKIYQDMIQVGEFSNPVVQNNNVKTNCDPNNILERV
jgi:bifunctional pyridoxal-dependent enzyme with beta-cystathionase and maltose regulon repressor activities